MLVTRTLKTAGIGEGTVDEIDHAAAGVAEPEHRHLRARTACTCGLAAKAPTEEEAWRLILPMEEEIRRRLGPVVWGADDDTFESIVGDMMKERGVTLATMESCTGGLLASMITDVPGSSYVLPRRARLVPDGDEDRVRRRPRR